MSNQLGFIISDKKPLLLGGEIDVVLATTENVDKAVSV
jgi:hypothetical protein